MLRPFWIIIALGVLALGMATARAEEARPREACELLVPARQHPEQAGKTRGATPAFDLAKAKLREWIGAHLADFPHEGADVDALAVQLNGELSEATAACNQELPPRLQRSPYDDTASVGLIRALGLRRIGDDFIVADTSLGIECGEDDSAYLFAWQQSEWKLVWRSEQAVDLGRYEPRGIKDLDVRSLAKAKDTNILDAGHSDLIVMMTGVHESCNSIWHSVYYGLWRLDPHTGATRRLLDRKEIADTLDESIDATLRDNEATFEFTTMSLDVDVLFRPAVKVFHIDDRGAIRVPPIAYGPRDFVEEWVSQPWGESRAWTSAVTQPSLRKWHKKIREWGLGRFIESTRDCRYPADAWQVGINFGVRGRARHLSGGAVYFLVRRSRLFDLTLSDIATRPWPKCDQPDPDVDAR